MLKSKKAVVFINALAMGCLLFIAAPADAATSHGNQHRMTLFNLGTMWGQCQSNMMSQFSTSSQRQSMRMQSQSNMMQFGMPSQQQSMGMQGQFNMMPQSDMPSQQQSPGQFGPGGSISEFAGGNIVTQIADILDVEEQTIMDRLNDGDTLVDIAADYDMDEDELLEQLEDLQSDAIDEAVDAGTLTEDQADELKDQLAERLEQIVESTNMGSQNNYVSTSTGCGLYNLSIDVLTDIADILDIDEQTIIDKLKDGDTLVEIAADYDVSEDELLEQMEDLQSDDIDEAVDAGTLTEDQADTLKDQLADRLKQIINQTL